MRQFAHESDRVGEQHHLAAWEVELARAGIQGREEPVLDQHVRRTQPVQKGRLACIGVTDQRDRALTPSLASPALDPPGLIELPQVRLQPGHALHEAPSVHLELGLAWPTGADSTGLLTERMTTAPQTRQPVPQERQLHLGAPFGRAGVLSEDVEDHRRPVDGRSTQDLFQVPLLRWREVVVEHHGVGIDLEADGEELLGLALAQVGRGVRAGATLRDPAGYVGPCGIHQKGQFVEARLGCRLCPVRKGHAHQDDALPDLTGDQGVGEG